MFSFVSTATAVSSVAFVSIWRIFFPTVWSYPWPALKQTDTQDKKKTVLMAGSFNPPHLGHIEMIQYLASRYGHVIVVVGHNPNKTYAVSPAQRSDLLSLCIQQSDKDNSTNYHGSVVSVRTVSGYIWRKVPHAEIFFRGIRTWEKDGNEERILQIQNTWGPIVYGPFWMPRSTCFLQGNPKYNHISSTLIREICSEEGSSSKTTANDKKSVEELLKLLVPECIVPQVRRLYSKTHGNK